MIRVHVESAKNTNSVMGRIRVEAMKSHALAEPSRVETMKSSMAGKVPFYAGFRKYWICSLLRTDLRRMGQKPIFSDENDWMSEREQLEEYFSQALEVDLLLRLCPDDEDTIYQIVNLLVDTCATNRKLLHIAGDDKPAEVVRSRFMKLNADHIRFVLKCLAENSSPIRNMKQYLLASLYNAPTTMQLSYQNQTNHDLAMRG